MVLRAGCGFFRRRPLRESLVAAPVHADPPVTPRLPADPVDDGVGVLSIEHPRRNRIGATRLAALRRDDAGISPRRRLAQLVGGVLACINRKVQCRRQPCYRVLGAHDLRTQRGSVRGANAHVVLDAVPPGIVILDQRCGQGYQRLVFNVQLIEADQVECIVELDVAARRAFGGEGSREPTETRHRPPEPIHCIHRGAIIEMLEYLAEGRAHRDLEVGSRSTLAELGPDREIVWNQNRRRALGN